MIDSLRRTQIIRLLETRDDHLPQPVRRDHSPAGFIHNTQVRETCPDCFGETPGKVGCQTCKSRGYIEYLRERDPYAVEKVQPYGMTGDRHEKRRERDNELRRLEAQTSPPWTSAADELAYANQHPEPWEINRARKWRDHDYAALDNALELLRAHDQGAYHMLNAVYTYGYQEACVVVEVAIERGLRFVDARMPAVIRAPGDDQAVPALAKASLAYGKRPEHEQARERRTARVLRAHFEWGWSTEEIAQHESLTRRRVQQLIQGHAGESAAVASGPAA